MTAELPINRASQQKSGRRRLLQQLGAASVVAMPWKAPVWAQTPRAARAASAVDAAGEPLLIGGSSAGQALMRAWVSRFAPGTTYESVGSGAGMERAGAGTLDIGISDVALTPTALNQQGLVQVPLFADGIAVVLNVPNGSSVKLAAESLVEVYRGTQRDWAGNGMAALNPGAALGGLTPTAVGRADASGSTAVVTGYLSRVNRAWAKEFSNGLSVRWPGHVRAVRGSSEMAKTVLATPGAVGYVSLAEVRAQNLAAPQLPNAAGVYAAPNAAGVAVAVNSASWHDTARSADLDRVNAPGAWPLSFVVYALIKTSGRKASAAKTWINRVATEGQSDLTRLGLVPVPQAVRQARGDRLSLDTLA
jgi:phosphate transport system substrate-binding protein